MLSGKYYKAIIEIIERHTVEHTVYPGDEIIKHGFVKDLADYFAKGDPTFSRKHFIQACGSELT